ncbi:rhodanese-like domain-containing protein [Roseateles sp. BYS180W]|uniref:Rhodanese-like domain-containing protein n=1 Tax=Roseateles rivi TaxID=3299028 RepID=A0ABW7FRH0_9BURK
MKFLIENWYLVLAAVASGALLFAGGRGKTSGISPADAVQLINREKAVVLDVSEGEEFGRAHAKGARHLPLSALTAKVEGHKQLPTNKALPLVLFCANGTRAHRAAGILRKAGYEKAVAVQGGLTAWREASLPVDKAA